MTLFSRSSRFHLFIFLSLIATISSLALISSVGDADARNKRGHQQGPTRPSLPATPPLPSSNPRANTVAEAPKPEEKPAEEIQKADPQTTPVPEQKPAAATASEAKPTEEPVEKTEQQGPDRPGNEEKKPEHDASAEKADPATSPDRIYQNACPAIMNGEVQGELVPPLSEGVCGERSPLKITAIGKDNPVSLAAPVTTNCAMAGSLANWIVEIQKEAQKNFGSEIESITTGSDYQCRKVNNAHKGRVSEHAFANALDIVSFKFKNGKMTELGSGWKGKPEERAFWSSLHKASCERFMTVIGPDGDSAHQGNLHLDLGCHGKSCGARICQ
jgi:hypothetical protein